MTLRGTSKDENVQNCYALARVTYSEMMREKRYHCVDIVYLYNNLIKKLLLYRIIENDKNLAIQIFLYRFNMHITEAHNAFWFSQFFIYSYSLKITIDEAI